MTALFFALGSLSACDTVLDGWLRARSPVHGLERAFLLVFYLGRIVHLRSYLWLSDDSIAEAIERATVR